MAKVVNLFRLNPVAGTFGIEIECEGKGLPLLERGTWVSTDDGSLRGIFPDSRNEFILKKPLDKDDAIKAINELNRHFANNNSVLNFSFRTSVHVHVNMQDLDEVQVLNMIYLYLLFEESLVEYCGEGRRANRFCLRLQDADGLYDVLASLFTRGMRYLVEYREDMIRYSSINLAPLMKYGSIEFRAMRGTADVNVLGPWIEALQALRDRATKPKTTPILIRKELLDLGVEEFTYKVFGKELAQKILPKNFEDQVNLAHSLTLDIPFMFDRSPYIKKDEEKEQIKAKARAAEFLVMDELVHPGDINPIVEEAPVARDWRRRGVNPVAEDPRINMLDRQRNAMAAEAELRRQMQRDIMNDLMGGNDR